MELQESQKEIVKLLLGKKVLVGGALLEKIKKLDNEEKVALVKNRVEKTEKFDENSVSDLFEYKAEKTCDINEGNVSVVFSYTENAVKKKEVSDFVTYFRNRYRAIEQMLRNRTELQRTLSISRVLEKKESEKVAIIGLVSDKGETKNGNMVITLEDVSGTIKIIINKNRPDLFEQAKDIIYDEVIGITGTNREKIIFGDAIYWPDIPLHKELKKSPDESYAIFLSDIHVGSNNFVEDKFKRFIQWLKGEIETDSTEVVKKIKYLFIVGDLVDGVGIYPGQEDELIIKDIYKQYEESARLLNEIPKHIKIIICPGNHDAMRISEPQPPISRELAPKLYEMENVILVSNPSVVKIHKSSEFPGFDVLLYHGYSFDYYVANVDSIRNQGGYHRADLLMKFLLKRRHVSPAHSSSLYVPDIVADTLVISFIPDFFVTGHIHYTSVANYNNVTLICGSCWQSQTAFQLKVGHDPEPARVPLVNLQTRKVKILKF